MLYILGLLFLVTLVSLIWADETLKEIAEYRKRKAVGLDQDQDGADT